MSSVQLDSYLCILIFWLCSSRNGHVLLFLKDISLPAAHPENKLLQDWVERKSEWLPAFLLAKDGRVRSEGYRIKIVRTRSSRLAPRSHRGWAVCLTAMQAVDAANNRKSWGTWKEAAALRWAGAQPSWNCVWLIKNSGPCSSHHSAWRKPARDAQGRHRWRGQLRCQLCSRPLASMFPRADSCQLVRH